VKRYFTFTILWLICLSACSPNPKGKAICDCKESGFVAIYTLGKVSIEQADTECFKIQAQLPAGDSCWAFIDN
jgi:hypothetical protein